MRSLGVASYLLFIGIISRSLGHLNDVLSSYGTLHSRDLVTHHVKRRDVDFDSLYTTERVVSFSSFGRAFRLRLYRQEGLFSDELFAADVGENQTAEIYLNENEFYTGFTDGESRSLKTFAYWEDDNLVATIKTRNDTFFVEPSWRHLPESDNYTMVIYRLSDVRAAAAQLADDHMAYCSPPELNDTLSSSVDGNSISVWHYASNLTERRKRVKRNNGEQQQGQHTVCSVMLVADYRFFTSVGQSSITSTAKYMIGVLARVNSIYTNTNFGQNFGNLGFEIEGVLVHSSPETSVPNHYNVGRTKWDTGELLKAFSLNPDWEKYCLVHLFTSTAFDNGVLGLAWVASDKPRSLGGICSPCSDGKCYNTGWSTSLNKFENKLTTLEADLVTAHEMGHGWGAQHDPDRSECSPSTSENGKFIMYPFSVSGREPNNDKFSPCSRKSISNVLQVKKESCFVSPRNSYCGNYKVEEGEECDAGPEGRAGKDSCCDSQCQLKNGSDCSDSNANCCQNCTFAPRTKLCWTSSADDYMSSCRANSYCPGNSTVCPETALSDQTPCANNGHCMNGVCLDACEYSGLISCICDNVENSCVWCCKESANASCQPVNKFNGSDAPLNLVDGYPCKQGYCQSGKCQHSIRTATNRLWDFIQHLNVDQILVFMRKNLVLATVILTLIPYLVFCIVICSIDYKKQLKAKKRQAWLDKNNDQLTLDKMSSNVMKIEGIHNRRFYGH